MSSRLKDSPLPSPPESNESRSAGGFSVARTEGRVGAPAPLRPLPLQFTSPGASLSLLENYTEEFTLKAAEILSQCGVEFDDIDFGARAAPRPDAHSMPTILVYASWNQSALERWSNAVRHIKTYADSRLSGSDYFTSPTVSVEIVDLDLVDRPKIMGPVLNEYPQLELDWPQIQHKVLEILEGFDATRDKWNTIALLRLGYSKNVEDNPVTVFISVDDDIPDSASILKQIQDYLDSLAHDLIAHMEKNTIDLYTFELLQPRNKDTAEVPYAPGPPMQRYPQHVGLGCDFGPSLYLRRDDGARSNPGFGTLGCYVEIKTVSIPEWTRYALTNYHVVRPCFDGFCLRAKTTEDGSVRAELGVPEQNSTLVRVDQSGFSPKFLPTRQLVESPSRRKHNYAIDELRETVKNMEGQEGSKARREFQADLNANLAFFDQDRHILGELFAGSGFARRSARNGRLDWALIKVRPNRQGTNALPPHSEWAEKYRAAHIPFKTIDISLKPPSTRPFRDLMGGEIVFKRGARTGATIGTFSAYKASCRVGHEKHLRLPPSAEYLFFHPTGDLFRLGNFHAGQPRFADQGDSGSVVYNASGEVLGLLFSGQSPNEVKDRAGYTFVTPIEEILEDIKAFSKGQITDIRILPS